MSDTGFAEKLRNLSRLVEMGEAGLERAEVLRNELVLQPVVGAKKIRAAIRMGANKHFQDLQKKVL